MCGQIPNLGQRCGTPCKSFHLSRCLVFSLRPGGAHVSEVPSSSCWQVWLCMFENPLFVNCTRAPGLTCTLSSPSHMPLFLPGFLSGEVVCPSPSSGFCHPVGLCLHRQACPSSAGQPSPRPLPPPVPAALLATGRRPETMQAILTVTGRRC